MPRSKLSCPPRNTATERQCRSTLRERRAHRSTASAAANIPSTVPATVESHFNLQTTAPHGCYSPLHKLTSGLYRPIACMLEVLPVPTLIAPSKATPFLVPRNARQKSGQRAEPRHLHVSACPSSQASLTARQAVRDGNLSRSSAVGARGYRRLSRSATQDYATERRVHSQLPTACLFVLTPCAFRLSGPDIHALPYAIVYLPWCRLGMVAMRGLRRIRAHALSDIPAHRPE